MLSKHKAVLNRRQLLRSSAALAAAPLAPMLGSAQAAQPPATVRDRLWLWSHVAGSYNGRYNLPGHSRITPTEAALYMSIPNVFMIHVDGKPEPPLEQYALPFESLREVVWGIVAAGGVTNEAERKMVLDLALKNPKISGVVMDDFFTGKRDGKIASLTVEEVRALKQRLTAGAKKLDLSVVLYEHQLDAPIAEHLSLCDIVQLWTWYGQNLRDLPAYLEKARQLAPNAKMALGIYWWDFGNKKPLPMADMQYQCEQALEWLVSGQIEAAVFCGSWLCDRGLETVAWTRDWIKQVGDQRAPGSRKAG